MIPGPVLGFPEYRDQGQGLARALGVPYRDVEIHHFPDGESRVRLPSDLPERVLFCRSLDRPNGKLVELAFASHGARALGVRALTLVAPYLCYMRQDTAFHPGEAVSQRIIGALLAGWFDGLVTVDPHLHRVRELSEAVPARWSLSLQAAPLIARFLGERLPDSLLVGPDGESIRWVEAMGRAAGLQWRVGQKMRRGDRVVEVAVPPGPYSGRHLVLVDDVASTGRTLEAAAKVLGRQDPASISVLVTHALFVGDAVERLRDLGVGHIWSTDSITHPSNAIALAPLLADALGTLSECAPYPGPGRNA